MSTKILETQDRDGYGDFYFAYITDPEDGSDELDFLVGDDISRVLLGLSVPQVQEISDALRNWLDRKRRAEVQRIRGSLS